MGQSPSKDELKAEVSRYKQKERDQLAVAEKLRNEKRVLYRQVAELDARVAERPEDWAPRIQQAQATMDELEQRIRLAKQLLREALDSAKVHLERVRQADVHLENLKDQTVLLQEGHALTQEQHMQQLAHQSSSFMLFIVQLQPLVAPFCTQVINDSGGTGGVVQCGLCHQRWNKNDTLDGERKWHVEQCPHTLELWRHRQLQVPDYRTLYFKREEPEQKQEPEQGQKPEQEQEQGPPEYEEGAQVVRFRPIKPPSNAMGAVGS